MSKSQLQKEKDGQRWTHGARRTNSKKREPQGRTIPYNTLQARFAGDNTTTQVACSPEIHKGVHIAQAIAPNTKMREPQGRTITYNAPQARFTGDSKSSDNPNSNVCSLSQKWHKDNSH